MISRYDPFREALSLRRAMDQLFEQSFVNPNTMPGAQALLAPMDVCETNNGYEVDVALPGVRPEEAARSLRARGSTCSSNSFSIHQQHFRANARSLAASR